MVFLTDGLPTPDYRVGVVDVSRQVGRIRWIEGLKMELSTYGGQIRGYCVHK
jgi:hypothetical protein